ncbi:hypothetical protein Br6_02300 [Rhodococcus sp. Br-6]|nr:hypothetical protein Br6_02300 [Rhodococcus sp. Br-6]
MKASKAQRDHFVPQFTRPRTPSSPPSTAARPRRRFSHPTTRTAVAGLPTGPPSTTSVAPTSAPRVRMPKRSPATAVRRPHEGCASNSTAMPSTPAPCASRATTVARCPASWRTVGDRSPAWPTSSALMTRCPRPTSTRRCCCPSTMPTRDRSHWRNPQRCNPRHLWHYPNRPESPSPGGATAYPKSAHPSISRYSTSFPVGSGIGRGSSAQQPSTGCCAVVIVASVLLRMRKRENSST